MELMLDGSGYVVLTAEPNLLRAHWIAGGIKAAGIPVHVEENNLQDEFAVAQKAMGAIRFRVLVPEDRLEEANTVFLDLSQPIPDDPAFHDEEDDAALEAMEEELKSGTSSIGFIVLLLAGAPFVVWLVVNWILSMRDG